MQQHAHVAAAFRLPTSSCTVTYASVRRTSVHMQQQQQARPAAAAARPQAAAPGPAAAAAAPAGAKGDLPADFFEPAAKVGTTGHLVEAMQSVRGRERATSTTEHATVRPWGNVQQWSGLGCESTKGLRDGNHLDYPIRALVWITGSQLPFRQRLQQHSPTDLSSCHILHGVHVTYAYYIHRACPIRGPRLCCGPCPTSPPLV